MTDETMNEMTQPTAIPRIERLTVKNYRVLRAIDMKELTPLTVLVGPNGSGKSTVFDVFAFLAECFTGGVRRAVDKRNRFRELRSRGETGPITFELKYRETSDMPLITYHLALDEDANGRVVVVEEWLQWRRSERGRPFRFLEFSMGKGKVASGDMPDEDDQRIDEELELPDMLAVNTLGQFTRHPRVSALRRFITGWYLSYVSADTTRTTPDAGPQERLSQTGDNLPNVIQYLKEQHPERLNAILRLLAQRVPQLERVESEMLKDGRLVLQFHDAPFHQPILAKFASDGTLKMLAYLTVLYDPTPPQLIGIEEPENHLHPRLLRELAEECRTASAHTQLMVTTHTPFFVNGLRSKEVRVLHRDEQGYTRVKRAYDIDGIADLIKEGALLGDLWMEGYFGIGDPFIAPGNTKRNSDDTEQG